MKKIKWNKTQMEMLIAVVVLILIMLFVSLFYEGIAARQETDTSAEKSEQIELDFVYAYQNSQWNSAIEKTVESFEEAYPDIKINYEINYGHEVYEDILSEKIARDELGDIVQLKTPEAYAKSGLLGEISDEVSGLVSLDYIYEDKIYAVGAVQATTGIIYNKKIFEKYQLQEPKTYEEFLQICQVIKDNGITPIGVAGSDLWHMEYWVNHFFRTDVLAQNENWLVDCRDGLVSWTDAEPTAMMQHLLGLFENGYVNENWLATVDSTLSYRMTEGEIAMLYTGPWTAAAIEKLDENMELGWFYVPDEDGEIYAGCNEDTYWAVTASCAEDAEKYEAAMTFLSYFYSGENYGNLCENTYTFPLTTQTTAYEVTQMQQDVYTSFADADKQISVYIGNEDTPQEFEKKMLNITISILDGDLSQEDGLQWIQESWEQLCIQKEGE